MGWRSNVGKGVGVGGDSTGLVNQQSSYYYATENKSYWVQIELAEVIQINLNPGDLKNFGRIVFRLPTDAGRDESMLSSALPINQNFVRYPVLHELVGIFEFNGTFYYDCAVNLSNVVNNNATKDATKIDIKLSTKNDVKQYEKISQSNIPNSTLQAPEYNIGKNFKDLKYNVPALIPYMGDMILSGRYGNYIRFGCDSGTGKPTLKMSMINKFVDSYVAIQENLDSESCIWITSDEIVKFKKPNTIINDRGGASTEYRGNQIVMSSDRILFNSKAEEIVFFSKRGIHSVCDKKYTIDSGDSILVNAKNNIEIGTEQTTIITSNSCIVDSKKIFLGKDSAKEPLVFGNVLISLLEDLLDAMTAETHIGPMGPPSIDSQLKYKKIKKRLNEIVSKQNYTM